MPHHRQYVNRCTQLEELEIMIALGFFLILLVLSSGNAISFLRTYYRLRKNGVQRFGKVVAYESSRHVMSMNVLLPKVEVQGFQNEPIVAKPISSWFAELNFMKLHEEVPLLQDKTNPNKFVIKGIAEPMANVLVIILAIGYLIWFTAKLL